MNTSSLVVSRVCFPRCLIGSSLCLPSPLVVCQCSCVNSSTSCCPFSSLPLYPLLSVICAVVAFVQSPMSALVQKILTFYPGKYAVLPEVMSFCLSSDFFGHIEVVRAPFVGCRELTAASNFLSTVRTRLPLPVRCPLPVCCPFAFALPPICMRGADDKGA